MYLLLTLVFVYFITIGASSILFIPSCRFVVLKPHLNNSVIIKEALYVSQIGNLNNLLQHSANIGST